MKLFEMFRKDAKVIAEGGNVSSTSPGWQGAADQEAEEIDLKIHDRDFMVSQLRTLLAAQNESFKAAYGRYIWSPKLLKSGQMFSGSSLQFFDVKGVNTQDFMNKLKKTKVGDIDTQVDQEIGDEITAWLKSIIGKKVGNGTFIGFNSSLSSIWLLDDPQVRIQVDYELGPYDPKTQAPTEWFAYSHSSHYDDMAAGIKGVFHKYINRALTHAKPTTKYVARVLKKSVKFSDQPVTDSDYSFAVAGGQGGGMSLKYKPYIDPASGQPMEKDGVPVMQLLDPKDRDYIQNLDQQFQITYGRKRTAADKNLQGSFVGTLQLMNKAFTPEQNEAAARAFLDILFGHGAQMITKDDPVRDRDTKFAAVDAMLLGGNGIKPLNLPNAKGLRQEAVKMAMDYADKFAAKKAGKAAPDTEIAEDAEAAAAAKPNYARQGIKHIYNRLPDGRVSSMEMKDAEFQGVAREIMDNGGNLNGMAVNLKVDGAGIRFGKDEAGRPFMMTSKVTTPLYQDDVGYFTSYGQEKGQDPETLARTKRYDDALALITGSKFIQSLPPDTIVQAEMMYVPMAQKTDQGLKFVNISYDPKKLGRQMTLVPFMVKQYSTGEDLPNADKVISRLMASSDSNIKIITNRLEQKGINVAKILQPILDIDPKDKANKPLFDKAKQELSDAIINSPRLKGKDALGDSMEGIVVNLPSGGLFKVTSQQMKSAMAAKSAPQSFGDTKPRTAVVAIGNFAGHRGHEQLIDYAVAKANELGGTPFVFVGHKVGPDDPIDINTKLETLKRLYPNVAISVVQNQMDPATGSETQGSIFKKIEYELIKKEPFYNNIVITVGSDQAGLEKTVQQMQNRYAKFAPLSHVKVSLYVTPRDSAQGGTGISTTQLRNALKTMPEDQAFNVWSQAYNVKKLGADWIKHLMDVARKHMGIKQQPQPQAQPALQPVAESRLFNALIRGERDMCNVCGQTPCNCTHISEDWQKVNKKDKTDGMSSKAVKAYRRENPGSKLKTAVTTKPSKLKKGSKSAKRRKSFCARMSGMKKAHASAKTKRDPDSPINKALRRWNCEESVDKEYRGWGEYEYETQQKAGQALDYIHELNPDVFTRHGDEFMMDLASKVAADSPDASTMEVAGNILRHLKTMYESKNPAIKLQRAWEREQQKSAASAKRGREYMAKIKQDVADKEKKKEQGVVEDTITESPTIDFIRGLIGEFNTQMSGSPYYPMDYKNPGMRMWTRGDGSKYKDPGYIFIERDLKPEDQPKWHKAKAVEKFWKFLESKGARKIGDVSGEFGSDPHSPAVVLNKLIFVFNGRSIAWGSTSRLKNSSVWRQKQPDVAEGNSKAIASTAKSLENPPKIMQHRAKRDQEREQQLKYRDTPRRDEKQEEAMLPKSSFVGSDKNKLGPAAHLKGAMKRPARQGDLVGGESYEKKKGSDGKACWKGKRYAGTKNGKDICIPVSEDVESLMSNLIEKIIVNEAIQNNNRKS